MPYFESLKQLAVENIPLISQPRENGADDKRRDRNETDSDWLLLNDFVKLLLDPEIPIPNLINMANNLPPHGESFQLYTNETRVEFHLLLVKLLQSFKNALDALVTMGKRSDKVSDGEFNRTVGDVYVYGYALLRISRGRAFRMHLENIEDLLEDPRQSSANVRAIEGFIDEELEAIEGLIDEELEAIQSFPSQKGRGGKSALSKSYTAWLRLVVGHFDAVEILIRYVTSQHFPYDSISVKILLSPSTDSNLLPWSKLQNYLPSFSDITNAEIHNFLQKNITMSLKASNAINNAQNALQSFKQHNYNKTRQSLQLFMKPLTASDDKSDVEDSEVLKKKATEILSQIPGKTNDGNLNGFGIISDIQALCDMLEELSDRDRFFISLNSLSFKGTMHCEACLASLLPAFTQEIPANDVSKYKDIKILLEMQVISSFSFV